MTTPPTATRPAYRDANVLRWLTGLWLSLLGDQVFFIALTWTATRVASPALTGLVVAAGAIPRAALMLFGGAVADRVGPKRIAMSSDAARMVVMLAFAGLLMLEQPSVVVLVVLAALFGVIDALFIPAVGALPPHLAEPSEMARLQAMRQTVTHAGVILGAPLAGWLVAQHGLATAYAVNAVLFALSVLALALTRLRPAPSNVPSAADATDEGRRPSLAADVVSGLAYVRTHHLLLPLTILTAVAELGFTGAINVGLPLLAADNSWGAQGVGLVLGGFGIGAAVTALAIAAVGNLPRPGLLICLCLPGMGAALAVIGLADSAWQAALAAAGLGVGSGVVAAMLGALILTVTDPDQLGRVVALSGLASFGGIPLAFTVTGVLADLTDPTVPFLLGGALSAVAGFAALTVTPLRRASLVPGGPRTTLE